MPIMPHGLAQPQEVAKVVNDAVAALPADVVRVRHSIGNDWSGDAAIFFWIVLTDEASKPPNLRRATTQVSDTLLRIIDPFHNWGLIPYFNFRSQSEQSALQDEVYG